MTSPMTSNHDLRAMTAACGSVAVALLPLLVLWPAARLAPAFAILTPILLAVLFLLTGLRVGLSPASGRRNRSRLLLSLVSPLLGALALVLPEVPGLCLLALVFLVAAHGDGLAVERGHLPRSYGFGMNLVSGAAVVVLLAMLVGRLT